MVDDEGEAVLSLPIATVHSLLETRDLSEVKVVLLIAHLSGAQERPVATHELLTSQAIRMVSGTESSVPGEQRVADALRRAVVNGRLLRVTVSSDSGSEAYYLLAHGAGAEQVQRLRAGDPEAAHELGFPVNAATTVYRPNVFAFYEQHLGTLTPILAEQLRDAERSYPRNWIEEAILTAADANVRNWRYIQTVLSRWEETGAPTATGRSGPS